MQTRTDPPQRATTIDWTIAVWRLRIFFRLIAYLVRHTLHGKLGVAAAVILTAMMAQVTLNGFLKPLPPTVAGLDGLLFVVHLWLLLSASSMILCQFAKAFLKNRDDDPLVAHPALFAASARNRVLASIPQVGIIFTGLFFAYFWQQLADRLDNLWVAIPVHLVTTALLVFFLAILVGSFGRILLRFASQRGIRNPNVLVNVTGGVAMAIFGVLLLAIIIANDKAVGALESIGNSIAVSIPIAMIPFAAALAADEGRWLALMGWLGLSALLALWGLRATYRWSLVAHREIPIDLASPTRRVFQSVFTGLRGKWLPPGVWAFWRKDIVVPYSREPKRYLFHQVNLLWWGIMAVVLAMALRNRGTINTEFADTIPVIITIFAMAIIAMQNGLNALGREGKELTWLRPLFSGQQLFGRKLAINWIYVLVHSFVYVTVVYAAVTATSLGTSISSLLLYATGTGTVFAALATAIGFLLPDFECGKSALPGSTTVGKGIYLLGALLLIAMTGASHLLLIAGVADAGFFAGMLTFGLVCCSVAFVLIAAAAFRQYQGMEI